MYPQYGQRATLYGIQFLHLAQTDPFHQLTQTLGFSIPFHLYIHNHDTEQAVSTLTWVANMYP